MGEQGPLLHVPQLPPQPSSPQLLPVQSRLQTHLFVAESQAPLQQSPSTLQVLPFAVQH